MATVGVGTITRAGNTTDLSPHAASASGDKFPAGRGVFLVFQNASEADITVTVATPRTVEGLAVEDLEITVPAGGIAVRGDFPEHVFGDATGLVSMSYSAHTDLTFGVWKVA